jgi:hypothetical protein
MYVGIKTKDRTKINKLNEQISIHKNNTQSPVSKQIMMTKPIYAYNINKNIKYQN